MGDNGKNSWRPFLRGATGNNVQYGHRCLNVQGLPRVSLPVPGIIRTLVPRSVILDAIQY